MSANSTTSYRVTLHHATCYHLPHYTMLHILTCHMFQLCKDGGGGKEVCLCQVPLLLLLLLLHDQLQESPHGQKLPMIIRGNMDIMITRPSMVDMGIKNMVIMIDLRITVSMLCFTLPET